MNRGQLNRRRFLKLVGASALTYPFLRSLPSYAAGATDSPYLVLLFTPNGVVRHLWGAAGAMPTGGAATTTRPLVFRPTLAPLMPLADQVIVLDGLSVSAAGKGSHEPGMAALWTGQTSTSGQVAGPSIDQAIASQLNAGRPDPSIQLMVRSSADFVGREVKTRMLYSTNGGYVDPIDDPAAARSTLFPTLPASMAGPDKKTFIRQKVFGQLNNDLTSMQTRLCNEDRHQLQNLQQAWNDLDSQLTKAAMAAASCSVPPAPPSGYSSPSIDFPTSAKLQMDILALALACDLTRVASLQFSTSTSQVTHTWIDSTQKDTHHNLSHVGPTSLYFLGTDFYNEPASVIAQYAPQLTGIDLWYTQQVAYLATRLSQLTVGGKNLLAQSVICWGNELDMGAAHNHDDTPFVLIGGGGGKLKTGQLVQFPLNLDGYPSTSGIKNRSHNDLLITLAQVMGVNMTTFGDAQYCTGPIKEILA